MKGRTDPFLGLLNSSKHFSISTLLYGNISALRRLGLSSNRPSLSAKFHSPAKHNRISYGISAKSSSLKKRVSDTVCVAYFISKKYTRRRRKPSLKLGSYLRAQKIRLAFSARRLF